MRPMSAQDEERVRDRWRAFGRFGMRMLMAIGMTMAGQAIPEAFADESFDDTRRHDQHG